ncbi:MAG: hypothetical protein R6U84_06505 [Candidatus Cloacimonadales bacterium]
MRYKFMIAFLLITLALSANSIFSFQGMANQYYGNDLYSSGMGDAGINDLFRINTGYRNPSMLASSNIVIFSTAVSSGFQNYYDDNDNSFRDDGFFLPYFTASFPILQHRFGLKYSLLSSGNLDTFSENTLVSDDDEEFAYTEQNSIISNVYQIDLAYAWKNRFLNLGIAGNYYIGHRINYWEFDFEDATLLDSEYERTELFKNPGFTVGISKRLEKFSMGLAYSNPVELKGDITFAYDHPPYEDELASPDFFLEVPAKISAGVTWKFAETFKLHADAHLEMWEDTKSYEENSTKFAAGLSYDPLSGYGKWYESIPLRSGFSYRKLPFQINNSQINELKASFGLSIPLQSPNKRIDLAVEYLTRGDSAEHGFSEDSLMFSIGVTGFDIFSRRPKKIAPRDIPEAEF